MMAFSIMGQNAATWKPVEGKHASIFGMHDRAGMASSSASGEDGSSSNMLLNADLAAATNALRNVTITKATLLQCHNNFGVPLGVTVNCLPKNEVIDTGDRYTFTTIPNTSINTPFTLYEAGESHQQAMEWRKTFGKFTASNLSTQVRTHFCTCCLVFLLTSDVLGAGCVGGAKLLLRLCPREPPGRQPAAHQQACRGRGH